MGSIKDKVAIVGMGCTKFGELWDKGQDDLIIEAALEAYEDAGIEQKDIEAAWVGTMFSGDTGRVLSEPLKLNYIPVTRVENMCATGSDAMRNAAYAVAAGVYDVVLALGVEKLKDTGWMGLGKVPFPSESRGLMGSQGMSGPSAFALLATAYFAKYGLSPQEGKRMIGMISVKSHHNGAMHPKAHLRREVTIDQVLAAPIIAWPLGLFDCCGVTDGAAAAILCRADMAKNFRVDPVYIKALQISVGQNQGWCQNDFEFTSVYETVHAGKAAFAEAGIKNPREEISMAQVHDCFSITEAVIMEDLEFSPRGRVKEDIDSGFFELTGGLPVQTDGGLKSFGHPIGASGLRMMYECYKQFQGKCGERQLKDPKLGLTHNLGGFPATATVSCCIAGL
ncbi:MAG: acetyl-CoA acetyltransferase [Dehalococcoidia bacterium]|jgi:acetyl-CoA C-acetyltransferase|nr:acetyl-CoA acetyltransferase [Dehalococcoidia bacterium]